MVLKIVINESRESYNLLCHLKGKWKFRNSQPSVLQMHKQTIWNKIEGWWLTLWIRWRHPTKQKKSDIYDGNTRPLSQLKK